LDKENDSSLILIPEEIKEFPSRTITASGLDEYLPTIEQYFQERSSTLISVEKPLISTGFQLTTFSTISY